MKKRHDTSERRVGRGAEPVQVYLDAADQERLDRLTAKLDTNKSDVLRRGLAALESAIRPASGSAAAPVALPTFAGKGLQPGVDLDDTAGLLDLMGSGDAAG